MVVYYWVMFNNTFLIQESFLYKKIVIDVRLSCEYILIEDLFYHFISQNWNLNAQICLGQLDLSYKMFLKS